MKATKKKGLKTKLKRMRKNRNLSYKKDKV